MFCTDLWSRGRYIIPNCQSMPSELGGWARGQDKHRLGSPVAGPIR